MNEGVKIILFLDFDGTLSRIERNPDDAVLVPEARAWLRKLSRRKNIKAGIVTGRGLSDIRRRASFKNIIYAANHGMEIYHKGRYLLRKGRVYKRSLRLLADELSGSLSDISGAAVENKGLSVAVHFRKTKKNLHPVIKKISKKISKPYIKKFDFQLTAGKMILEIRPSKCWNKGMAVLWIWKKLAPGCIPVYIGDDVTDEDAFKALKPHGLTIRIGKSRNSHAEYFVNSIGEIIRSGIFD